MSMHARLNSGERKNAFYNYYNDTQALDGDGIFVYAILRVAVFARTKWKCSSLNSRRWFVFFSFSKCHTDKNLALLLEIFCSLVAWMDTNCECAFFSFLFWHDKTRQEMRRFNCWKNVRYLFFSRVAIYAILIAVTAAEWSRFVQLSVCVLFFFFSTMPMQFRLIFYCWHQFSDSLRTTELSERKHWIQVKHAEI